MKFRILHYSILFTEYAICSYQESYRLIRLARKSADFELKGLRNGFLFKIQLRIEKSFGIIYSERVSPVLSGTVNARSNITSDLKDLNEIL